MSKPQILLIDDSGSTLNQVAETLSRKLGDGVGYLTASDGVEALAILAKKRVDLVVCDVEMPGIDGFKLLTIMRQAPEYQDIPVIMLTVVRDVNARVRALTDGASDYVSKPYHDEELVARVRVHLKLKALQDELLRKNKRLEELSRTDPLTGLFNRRHFMEQLNAEVARTRRHGPPLSLVMIDVDHFKTVNDIHGHLGGDAALVSIASILKRLLRESDFATRYGGEEFSLVLPQTAQEGANIVAERCRSEVENTEFLLGEQIANLTVSLGIATFPAECIDTADKLIRAADAALYAAKEAGRNRVCA